MARPPSKEPTDGELEILKILWEIGPAGLGQIHRALEERREVATTTVATMLKLMLGKELVKREEGPRGYLWSAGVSRNTAVSGLLGKLLQRVFDGSARRLVAHLIEDGGLDDRERTEILELLKSQAHRADKPSPRKKGRSK
jgi:BlaI family transcriptional regulator, penicillinase repressor